MRITGLATGLDIDEIISSTMKAYRVKIDQKTQSKDVIEIKQTLYRDIMSDSSKFYDKYFDITKSDSLLKQSNYKSVKFTSSNENIITVTGGADAKAGNYKVAGNIATASKITTDSSVFGTEYEKDGEKYKKITINGKEFEVKSDNEKAMAKDLNTQLKNEGINVSVEYTQFTGDSKAGFVFQSTVLGSNATFTINGTSSEIGKADNGIDATASKIDGFTLNEIKNVGKITVNGKTIELDITSSTSDEEGFNKIKEKLSAEGIDVSAEKDADGKMDYNKIIFTSKTVGELEKEISISVGTNNGNTVVPGTRAEAATVSILTNSLTNGTYIIGENTVNLNFDKVSDKVEYLNKIFTENGIGVSVSKDGTDNIKFTSSTIGSKGNFTISKFEASGLVGTGGTDGSITITNTKTGGEYKTEGHSNTIKVDDMIFTINGEIPPEGITVTGKVDVTETKDKIVNFINDYNTLIEKLNTLTSTKHNRNYSPLTADQKKEMSETEIKLWNEKVEQGQLYKDSNLIRISSALKDSMRTFMTDSGLNLEKIGIIPVNDYSGTGNGTFSIDEEKLTKALEENTEDVMNLFTNTSPKALTEEEEKDPQKVEAYNKAKSQTGILYKLKDTLYSEFKSSTSVLSKKVGLQGTSTFSNNELTKSISDYESKIKDMEKEFTKREQALYSKYATLETMMNKLNSQQSSLQSMFGQ